MHTREACDGKIAGIECSYKSMEQIRESILERQSAEPEKPKSKWKFRIAFVAVIFLVLGVVIGARA